MHKTKAQIIYMYFCFEVGDAVLRFDFNQPLSILGESEPLTQNSSSEDYFYQMGDQSTDVSCTCKHS